MLDVALLGTGGMMPLPNRFLTSLLCRLNGKGLLIDCGEGTQVTLKMLGWGFKNIDAICFTHFHADHISGLPGLLLTIGNSGRTEPLRLYGPAGLQTIVGGLCMIAPELPFSLEYHEFANHTPQELSIGDFCLRALPLDHRIPCFAYHLVVSRAGKFDPERAVAQKIPQRIWSRLQKNETVVYEGKTYTSDMVLGDARKGIKLSYCTDSRPVAGLPDFVRDSDLLVCEGIYGDEERRDKAVLYKHMTFSEAAAIARNGDVKELWLTHYSPSLVNPKEHVQTARVIFPNTHAGFDRMVKCIGFEE